MRNALLWLAFAGVFMTRDLVSHAPQMPPDTAIAGGAQPRRAPFLDHTHVGRLVVAEVVQTPARHESHIQGLFVVPYQVTFEAKEVLPPSNQTRFVVSGARGEGVGAGALGLEDWLPTTPGTECVLAFTPPFEIAKQAAYLACGQSTPATWQSVERFYESLSATQLLDPDRVAGAIGTEPWPSAVFFQLVFEYDRGVFAHARVMRALSNYFANERVPALGRRTVAAFYLGEPGREDTAVLQDFVAALLRLTLHLQKDGLASSSGAVLQRVYGYVFDRGPQTARLPSPPLSQGDRSILLQLVNAPESGLNPAVAEGLRRWIQP